MTTITMQPTTESVPEPVLAPIIANQRIEALDVVRGFALLGIFLMNIEFFNRPVTTIGQGMPRGLTGIDWWASWFVAYFVQGKFWTIFSLLFGMGFAVMMTRAERTGRKFTLVYLRRVLALAVFGAAHFILLWEGDILFSYAIAALMLMIVLYGKPKPLIIGIVIAAGLAFIPHWGKLAPLPVGLVLAGLLAIHLRRGKQLTIRGRGVPLFSFLLLLIGSLVIVAAAVFWLLPNGPVEPRLPLSVFGPLLVVAGWLAWKYYEPGEKRSLRLGISIYVFLGIAITASGGVQRFAPDPDAVAVGSTIQQKRSAERRAEREKNLAEGKAKTETEQRIFASGNYWQAVKWRGSRFPEKAASDFGFAIVLVGMFLLGTWFVRSGVMENTSAHLELFRNLATYGLPVGIGVGLLGSAIAISHTPGDRYDGWGIASGLAILGNLPACLGYVGMVVVMLHSNTVLSRIRVLGPAGRMALTNYLTQSLISATYCYGYAMGHWGMPRAQQVLFVIVVYAAQIAFSHWWLARFDYGPMEWLWRGFTYWQVPPLVRTSSAPAVVTVTR
ncbi:MAG: DUF418 domain-containing protein [Vicinamibacterales bacterium]